VELRPEPQKNPNLNSPKEILFVIQRKTAEFPQDKNLHLATQFSVCLRVLPFWKDSPKNPNLKIQSISGQTTINLALSRRPIIKGLPTDLILLVTRLL
jgi:hypothetical protein